MNQRYDGMVQSTDRLGTILYRGPCCVGLILVPEHDKGQKPMPALFVRVIATLRTAHKNRPAGQGRVRRDQMIDKSLPGCLEPVPGHTGLKVELIEKLQHISRPAPDVLCSNPYVNGATWQASGCLA